jgi:hypothetical protein
MQRRSDHPWIKHIGAMDLVQDFCKQWNPMRERQRFQELKLKFVLVMIVAFHLYQKNGFKIEGRREKAPFIDGKFEDEFYIAKCL